MKLKIIISIVLSTIIMLVSLWVFENGKLENTFELVISVPASIAGVFSFGSGKSYFYIVFIIEIILISFVIYGLMSVFRLTS